MNHFKIEKDATGFSLFHGARKMAMGMTFWEANDALFHLTAQWRSPLPVKAIQLGPLRAEEALCR